MNKFTNILNQSKLFSNQNLVQWNKVIYLTVLITLNPKDVYEQFTNEQNQSFSEVLITNDTGQKEMEYVD